MAAGRGLLQPQYLDQLSQRPGYLHCGILDQGQLRPLGFAVSASRQHIMRCDDDLQRLAKVHLLAGERCGEHDVADYLVRVRAMQREFRRLAANP